MVQACRTVAVDEDPVRPGWTGERGEPLIADRKLLRQLVHYGQLYRGIEARHDVTDIGEGRGSERRLGGRGSVVAGETGIVDRRIRLAAMVYGAGSPELFDHVEKFMAGVGRH